MESLRRLRPTNEDTSMILKTLKKAAIVQKFVVKRRLLVQEKRSMINFLCVFLGNFSAVKPVFNSF